MKKGLIISIILLVCLAEMRPIFPIINYHINFDYISEVLCINRSNETSSCQGSCFLNKELKKTQQKNDNPIVAFDKEQYPRLLYKKLTLEIHPICPKVKHNYAYLFPINTNFLPTPFPPPKC